MDTSPPWSRTGSPSVTLPPPAGGASTPTPAEFPPAGSHGSNRLPAAPAASESELVVGDPRAAFGYRGLGRHRVSSHLRAAHDKRRAPRGQPPPRRQHRLPSATPQFSAADAAAAKANLCQVFDTSVRGQEGQGGLRVQGNLNLPIVSTGRSTARPLCRMRSRLRCHPKLQLQLVNT